MNIAITFTDQNPDGGAVIGKETYIVPVDEKYIPVKVINELKAPFCRAVEITIVKKITPAMCNIEYFKDNYGK